MQDSMYPKHPILIVDDERPWLNSLRLMLKASIGINHTVQCQDSTKVMDLLGTTPVSAVLLDLTMPKLSGEKLLPQITQKYPHIPVIILTGMNQADTAVACMHAGAFDYFVKSTEEERLVSGIRRALDMWSLKKENFRLKAKVLGEGLKQPKAFSEFTTNSPRMHSIFQYLEAVRSSREPVLITGESGVGKELVARALHQLCCPEEPFLAVNVAGLDENMFSDTLFGHTRGAFTGAEREHHGLIEKAHGGMLFFDEIGDLSHSCELKLLRLLQEKEYYPLGSNTLKRVNTRFIFATNQNLLKKKDSGAFRSDLYYRLNTHHVHIPPLRERQEDIPLLLDYFLEQAATTIGKKKPTPPKELPILLSTYSFPGNIRELRAMVHDAVSIHRGGQLSMDSFRAAICEAQGSAAETPSRTKMSTENLFENAHSLPTLADSTQMLINEALKRSKGNQSIAADILGISRQALNKRIRKMI